MTLPVSRFRQAGLFVAVLLNTCFIGCSHVGGFHFYEIPSVSMQPTLYEGDKIVVDEKYYASHALKDGDIIVFRHGENTIVKRLSALSGETIEGRNGVLIRNGQTLTETYIAPPKDADPVELLTFRPRTVGPNELFVTGDNRGASLDSRVDDFGPVHVQDVLGKVVSIYASTHGTAGRSF